MDIIGELHALATFSQREKCRHPIKKRLVFSGVKAKIKKPVQARERTTIIRSVD